MTPMSDISDIDNEVKLGLLPSPYFRLGSKVGGVVGAVASRARAGSGAAQLMGPPTGLPLPPPTKNSNYFVCVFVCV